MNIFAVDKDPRIAAEMLCDKHVVKMILESAQILSTVHRQYGSDDDILYKATHTKHPSTVWAGKCRENYSWLYQHFKSLADEYTYRYDKQHLSYTKLSDILAMPPKDMEFSNEHTLPTPAMPDECKIDNDIVKSYRLYYNMYKSGIAVWTKRPVPSWFTH